MVNQNRNKNLKDLDRALIWHPFTQMRDYEKEDPLIIERGEGNYLIDIDGKKYLDGISSLWVILHGHNRAEINEAIKKQIDLIAHSTLLGLSHVTSIEFAEKLLSHVPEGLKKVFYSDSGSTAVEIAIKMAFQYHQQSINPSSLEKTKFLTFENAYHGDTLGAVGVGVIDLFHEIYKPLLFQAIKANASNAVELIAKHHQELAAVIIEPMIQGAAGMLLHPKGLLGELRKVCDEFDVLLIFDEVATGFGRTGKMFACEHENITPDLMCVAKGISGGYLPLAVTLTTQKVYEGFLAEYKELKTFFHGHTYTGNPLACAAGIASLEIFEKEKVIEKIQPKIEKFKEGLKKFLELKCVKEIRQVGLMMGIELGPYSLEEKRGIKTILEARKRGVILRPLGNVIVLMPPLSITMDEIDCLLQVTFESIDRVNS